MNLINTEFTLLIVDDEKQNRLLLTELFGGAQRIVQAKNGVQALEKARQHRPDLILLDVLVQKMGQAWACCASSNATMPPASFL